MSVHWWPNAREMQAYSVFADLELEIVSRVYDVVARRYTCITYREWFAISIGGVSYALVNAAANANSYEHRHMYMKREILTTPKNTSHCSLKSRLQRIKVRQWHRGIVVTQGDHEFTERSVSDLRSGGSMQTYFSRRVRFRVHVLFWSSMLYLTILPLGGES